MADNGDFQTMYAMLKVHSANQAKEIERLQERLANPPADAALADDALCESIIEASDMRWNGDVYVGDGADLMNLVRAALRARAVPDEPPEWPEYHEHGMGCGIEDRGITDRYEACRYGFEEAVERCVEAFDNWLAASKSGEGK